MKLIHLTARRFQFLTADSFYVENLARHFHKILENNYYLVLAGESPGQFADIRRTNLNINIFLNRHFFQFWLPIIIYFFWLPYFVLVRKFFRDDAYFFANDPNLLCILIFWKKIFRFNYKICSDWHWVYGNWKDGYIAGNSDKLIATSEKLKRFIIEKTKVDPAKIAVIYGGVDLEKIPIVDKIAARKKLNLPQDKILIGYVGLFKTMAMDKGIDIMIKALPRLPDDNMMVFVGGKPEEIDEYKNLAEKINVAGRCIFETRKNFGQVAIYEQAMDILTIPYPDKPHFRNYGFPMKVYEYMAARRPIIYSRLELTEEILNDCGYTFTPDDPEDLAKTINYVSNNGEEAEKKTESAYSKLKEFTWEKKAEKIINFIKS